MSGLGGYQTASNIDQVNRYLVREVIHHVVHLHLYRAVVLRGMSTPLRGRYTHARDSGSSELIAKAFSGSEDSGN